MALIGPLALKDSSLFSQIHASQEKGLGNCSWVLPTIGNWILIQGTSQEKMVTRDLDFDLDYEISGSHVSLWIQFPHL